jgi:endonuclease/exonuclease/phosphatase family metal-dependent hydrolase
MYEREKLLDGLRVHKTLRDLHSSAFFAEAEPVIRELLGTPQVTSCADAEPRLRSFLRIATWNIEKGKQLPRILETLRSDQVLRCADVLFLNEADAGMARSGNRDVARDVAAALRMHVVFGPAHLELTKGTEDDLGAPGENRESLQGNAVLTRHPVIDARVVPLPACFEPFEFHEKRYGTRNCVWARIEIGRRTMWLGSVHFEVRKTPACRARQMRHLLANLPGRADEAHVIAGDFNTSGFSRGTRWRTFRSVATLLSTEPAVMKERLCHPERGPEPLFDAAYAAGFRWEGFNSYDPTASTPIGSLEDSAMLPGPLARFAAGRLSAYDGYFRFKLDWILGKGLVSASRGEIVDAVAGENSLEPGAREVESIGAARISDHRPIFADIKV